MNDPQPRSSPNPSRTRRWLARATILGACVAAGPVFAALVPVDVRPHKIDLVAHFAPHAAAPLLVLALTGIALRVRAAILIPAALLALDAAIVLLAYKPLALPPTVPEGAQRVRVVHFNALNVASMNDDEFLDWLFAQDADLVSLVDAPPGILQRSEALSERYPHRVTPRRGVEWPIVLLSKHPVREVSIGPTDKDTRTSFVARRSVVVSFPNGAEALFTALHPYSPRNERSWARSIETARRDGQLLRLAREQSGIPVIAPGDFNSTPTGRVYRTFARASGLRAAPVLPVGTWPAARPRLLGVAIDHVFISPGIVRLDRRVGPAFRSDHRPIVVELAVPAPADAQKSPPPPEESSPSD